MTTHESRQMLAKAQDINPESPKLHAALALAEAVAAVETAEAAREQADLARCMLRLALLDTDIIDDVERKLFIADIRYEAGVQPIPRPKPDTTTTEGTTP